MDQGCPVHGDVVAIDPDTSGLVEDIRLKDSQFVRKNDVLLVIDRARYTRDQGAAESLVTVSSTRSGIARCCRPISPGSDRTQHGSALPLRCVAAAAAAAR